MLIIANLKMITKFNGKKILYLNSEILDRFAIKCMGYLSGTLYYAYIYIT